MYIPSHNSWTDLDEVVSFCKAHPFALLVSVDSAGSRPVGTHLPVIINNVNDELVCTLHVARANTHWKSIANEVMIVFSGPHAYISPHGYTELDVPTWNYIAVHMYGTVKIIEQRDEVRSRLRMLVDTHDTSDLWDQLDSRNEVDSLLSGIVMMDVHITDVHAKQKMSQNRSAHDRAYGEQQVLGPKKTQLR